MLKIKEKTQNAVPKYNYPLAFKITNDKEDKRIVLFFSERGGTVIKNDLVNHPQTPLGTVFTDWASHENSFWEPVDVEITH